MQDCFTFISERECPKMQQQTAYTNYRRRKKKHSGLSPLLFLFLFSLALAIAFVVYFSAPSPQQTAPNQSVGNFIPSSAVDPLPVKDSYPGFTKHTPEIKVSEGDLVLVDKDHPWSFPDNPELVSIYDYKTQSYFVRDTEVLLNKDVVFALNDLLDAFYENTGLQRINIVAGYRSYDNQQMLYDNSVAANGAAYTARYYMPAGSSEHHIGSAVDFALFDQSNGSSAEFTGKGEYAWIVENAWRYGFVQSYREDKTAITGISEETWHYRYIGVMHAYYIYSNELCLPEYHSYLKSYTSPEAPLEIDVEGAKYSVYYCMEGSVFVPENGSYEISGDNSGGYIITIEH